MAMEGKEEMGNNLLYVDLSCRDYNELMPIAVKLVSSRTSSSHIPQGTPKDVLFEQAGSHLRRFHSPHNRRVLSIARSAERKQVYQLR